VAYRLKYVHAASANKTIVAIQRDESLIPVFLATNHILSPTLHHESAELWTVLLSQSIVAVEKGTKAVISVNFSVCGERTFNNLRTNFVVEIP
jgi:hypothetical protein